MLFTFFFGHSEGMKLYSTDFIHYRQHAPLKTNILLTDESTYNLLTQTRDEHNFRIMHEARSGSVNKSGWLKNSGPLPTDPNVLI